MKKNSGDLVWRSLLFNSLVVSGVLIFLKCDRAFSQVTPDDTLGDESSVVNTRDATSDSIDGGAVRGQNLFHSFEEFNVGEDRGVYFSNPDDVTNIFSRVTGNNVSNILGTLGVDGAANLFLINPNGIVFGSGASLDVQGSFAATTADGIEFGEQGFFSASDPKESSLLTINPGAFFYNQVANKPGNIINQGNLTTGQNLTLDANNLDLEGQILASENLTLSALDTVKIRDSVNNPFIGAAKGNLLIRGDKTVDIFTLSNRESSLFSGGEMILQSSNPIKADSHFLSGGNFRIEQLDGRLGDINSPQDPIIRSFGDVSFNIYAGSSLHILAGGSVNIGTVFIDAPEIEVEGVDFIQETIQLSNGNEVSIDGSLQPTLDIRAGVEPNQIINSEITGENSTTDVFVDNSFVPERPTSTDTPISADIAINSISMVGENSSNGLILITNQYKSNSSLSGGTIEVDTVDTLITDDTSMGLSEFEFTGNGGSVIIDSRNNILVKNSIDSSGSLGNSGNITLLAEKNIDLFDGVGIEASLEGEGIGGNILIDAQGTLSFTSSNSENPTNIISNVITGGIGQGGNIDINAGSLFLNNAFIDASTFGQGDAGKITININDSIIFQDGTIFNNSEQEGIGKTGGVTIEGKSFSLEGNSSKLFNQLNSSTFTEGGGIQINVKSLSLSGESLIDSSVLGQGQAGDIFINVDSLNLSDKSQIGSAVFGQGQAGNIFINADNSISLVGDAKLFEPDFATGILTRIEPGGKGNAGNIIISTEKLSLSGAQITASIQGEGKAGNISIRANDTLVISNESAIFSSVDSGAIGLGGDIDIDSNSLFIDDGSQILTIVRGSSELNPLPGKGDAGNINVNVKDSLTISGLFLEDGTTAGFLASSVASGAEGTGGDINIKAGNLILNNFASLTSSLELDATGQAGNINIETGSISLNSGQVIAITAGEGNAGKIFISADKFIFLQDSDIASSAFSNSLGNGGDIQIKTSFLLLEGNSSINASTSVEGEGGNIKINALDITLKDDSDFGTFVLSGLGGGGDIDITADSVIAFDDSNIFAFAADGQGGNITLDTPAYFGENFTLNSLTSNPDSLENNSRADINATGAVSGDVTIPDVSSIQNSLNTLPNDSINTDELVANSCVVPAGDRKKGKFFITGTESFPLRPGDALPSKYPTGEVRNVPEKHSSWQPGDPIVEPQGAYRLANGKLVLSRECN